MDTLIQDGDYCLDDRGRPKSIEGTDELLQQADIVSLHLTLNDETRGFFDRAKLAKTKPGVRSPRMCRSLPKSVEMSEYAGETGAYGIPAYMAPRPSCRCSRSLPERIATGRSTFSPRLSRACATARAPWRAWA